MPKKSVSEQLRQAIQQCGKTRYKLAKLSGVDEATLSRYVRGLAGLGTKKVDALCECLNLRLVSDAEPNKAGAAKRAKR
jgi:transcriptional regulator with XRE-family HTH domain